MYEKQLFVLGDMTVAGHLFLVNNVYLWLYLCFETYKDNPSFYVPGSVKSISWKFKNPKIADLFAWKTQFNPEC